MRIFLKKSHHLAQTPSIAYNGTSAAFDLTCTEDTVIQSKGSAVVPNGLHLTIPHNEPYYMVVYLRSSMGFKQNLICHPGVIDAGYTGSLGVKIYNLGDEDVLIKAGDRYAQIVVHQKIDHEFVELNDSEWEDFAAAQTRGDNGFGSSNGN